jgi:hypothetical protein
VANESFDFRGALIREGNVTFAVVEVPFTLLQGGQKTVREERERYAQVFRNVPIVLAARDAQRKAHFLGRQDIVRFLIQAGWARIPWKRYRARKKDKNPFREWA